MSENSSTRKWECSEGCDVSKRSCIHLEKLISPESAKDPKFESVNRYAGSNVDQEYYESGAGYVIPEGIKNRSYEYQFRKKLEKAGLEPVKVDILVLRFVYEMNFKDIAEELGMVSITTTHRLYTEALATYKKKGVSK